MFDCTDSWLFDVRRSTFDEQQKPRPNPGRAQRWPESFPSNIEHRTSNSLLLALSRFLALTLIIAVTGCSEPQPTLRLIATTTTENSGLMAHLLPCFTDATGINVQLVTMGTGQAVRVAANGDADLLVIHDPDADAAFMAAGHGIRSRKVMSNEFLLVGPSNDPANIQGLKKVDRALRQIRASEAIFVSRGDDSGTHKRELDIWRWAGLDPHGGDPRHYREVGGGMGKTLNIAAALNAYTLVDRGTWLSFKNRQQLVVLSAGDPRLLNTYTVLEINPQKHPYVHQADAKVLANWLTGEPGQKLIDEFRVDGQRLFDPVNYQQTPSQAKSDIKAVKYQKPSTKIST